MVEVTKTLSTEEKESDSEILTILAYGVSGGSIEKELETITGVNPEKKSIHTDETGHIMVMPEVNLGLSASDIGFGEGAAIVLVIIAIMMVVFATIWTIVMILFSVVTMGGFIKRRYRTRVVMERENSEFIGKLSVLTFRSGGILNHSLGQDQYDEWMGQTFRLFKQLKILRQASMGLGFIWGLIEVGFKLYQLLVDPLFSYYLWPFRIVMLIIFIPLILYSPILERKFRRAFEAGDENIARLVTIEPSFNPDSPMKFKEKPRLVNFTWKGI